MNTLHQLLTRLWEDYRALNPDAGAIHRLLTSHGETIVNDHVAFRTFDVSPVNLEALAERFRGFGYHLGERYHFAEKHLEAAHYEHDDPSVPKIFISELRVEDFSSDFRHMIHHLVVQVSEKAVSQCDFVASGRPWQVSYETYERLAKESEYAAWLAAFGFRANHFTISVNALKKFRELAQLNALLKENGYVLNDSGGEIKGSPEDFLEQSSTQAHSVPVEFTDGIHVIPGCYYEFARRHRMANGRLFQGFVAKSADKIFESTNRRGN